MSRFDVYANPYTAERRVTPYFLDVQNDHLHGLATRIVVPLRRESAFGPRLQRLHPLVTVRQESLVLDTAALGAVPQAELRQSVGQLDAQRMDVQDALDALFGSY